MSTGRAVEGDKSSYNQIVPAVEQASRILFCLAQGPSFRMSLTEICNEVGIHKSKGFSILNTLQRFGFVEKSLEDKRYCLGPGLLPLSRRFLDSMDERSTINPFLEALAMETHCTAFFGLASDWHLFVVAKHEGDRGIGVTIRVGHRFSITHGAHGKAILAVMPEDEKERVLSGGRLYFHGEPGKFNRGRLEREMAEVRGKGYALDLGEMDPGINAIAAPVMGMKGKPVGSIFILGVFPEEMVKVYGPLVAGKAREISYRLSGNTGHEPIYGK